MSAPANLRHDNHADMLVLSSMVSLVPADMQTVFAAALLGRDLMRGPWWLRGLVGGVRIARGWDKTPTWHMFLTRFQRGLPEQVVADFARHIRHGRDTSDARSVGGLNQHEVEDTLFLLRNCLRGLELHPTYRAILDGRDRSSPPTFVQHEPGEFGDGATVSATGGDHG